MKTRFAVPLTLGILLAIPAFAQRPEERQQARPQEHQQERHDNVHGNQGRIPQAAPAKREPQARPEVERYQGGRVNSTPHVSNDHWYGHDKPNDKRFAVSRPFEHGRFDHVGASYRYHVERFDRDNHRFYFPGGLYFNIASWDWDVVSNWCWDCDGDNFTVYDDPDHPGWYLVYNVHTGAYIHAQYMGS